MSLRGIQPFAPKIPDFTPTFLQHGNSRYSRQATAVSNGSTLAATMWAAAAVGLHAVPHHRDVVLTKFGSN
jgi:hypothetical protein